MCGFVAIIHKDLSREPNSYTPIPNNLLSHRGPDATGEIVHDKFQIRHWRLSIVDLTDASSQPFENDDFIFAYNGELYDYKEIDKEFKRKSFGDTHTFYRLLTNSKADVSLNGFSGFFSYILYDKRKKIVTGGRDFIGKKTLYYYIDDDILVFSQEVKAILNFVKNRKVDWDTLGEFFLYKNNHSGSSHFVGVCEIPPGANFVFDIESWSLDVSCSWNEYYEKSLVDHFQFRRLGSNVNDFTYGNFENIFLKSVEKRLNCDVPVQIALSGGVDSTALVVGANILENQNVKRCLTVQFFEGEDESYVAGNTSHLLGIEHDVLQFHSSQILDLFERAIELSCCPLEHPHYLSYLILCEGARTQGKVLLTGEGADELFLGYNHYSNFDFQSFAFREFLTAEDEKNLVSMEDRKSFNRFRCNSIASSYRSRAIGSKFKSREFEFKTHLLSLLRRNDLMSMANSVEIRAPFLDPNLIQFALMAGEVELAQIRKQFICQFIQKVLVSFTPPLEKNGFRVPFDLNLVKMASDPRFNRWCDIGWSVLSEKFHITPGRNTLPSPRLVWQLLNIGCFIEKFGSFSD